MAKLTKIRLHSAKLKATVELDEQEVQGLIDQAALEAFIGAANVPLAIAASGGVDDLIARRDAEIASHQERQENGVDQRIDFERDRPTN